MRFMHLHTPTIIDSHFYTEFRQARMPRDIPGVHNSIIASAIVQRTHTQFQVYSKQSNIFIIHRVFNYFYSLSQRTE